MTSIAFVGLGIMGGPMAANLVRAGHTVTGYDIAQRGVDKLVAGAGTRRTASPPR